MIHAKSHPRVQHSKLWPGEVLLDQVVHRRFLSLDGELIEDVASDAHRTAPLR